LLDSSKEAGDDAVSGFLSYSLVCGERLDKLALADNVAQFGRHCHADRVSSARKMNVFHGRNPLFVASLVAGFGPEPLATQGLLRRNNGLGGAGGEDGIRTHEKLLTSTPLAGERLRPLGHLSGASLDSEKSRPAQ
jgi:hypothetical protein